MVLFCCVVGVLIWRRVHAILRDVAAIMALYVGARVSLSRWRNVYALTVVNLHIADRSAGRMRKNSSRPPVGDNCSPPSIQIFPMRRPHPFPENFLAVSVGLFECNLVVPEVPLRQLIEEKRGALPAPPLLSASQDMNAVLPVHLFHVFPARDTPRVDPCFVGNVFALDGVVGNAHPLPHSFVFGKVESGFRFNP